MNVISFIVRAPPIYRKEVGGSRVASASAAFFIGASPLALQF